MLGILEYVKYDVTDLVLESLKLVSNLFHEWNSKSNPRIFQDVDTEQLQKFNV